jgi:hypothetical protein
MVYIAFIVMSNTVFGISAVELTLMWNILMLKPYWSKT